MKPKPIHRLPAPVEAAVQRLKLAAREATERTIESLGLAALSATHAFQRDGLLGAQFELNRKSAVFILTFNDAFDDRVLREVGGGTATATAAGDSSATTNWDDLGLVDDREVEAQISADRFGMEMAVACEWELRELDAYVGALLSDAGGPPERNPLRPDIVGHAMIRGIEAVSDNADVRKVLSSEISRSLAGLLRTAYSAIVNDWRHAGVRPLSLSARIRSGREDTGHSRIGATTTTAGGMAGEGSSGGSGFAPADSLRSGSSRPGMAATTGGGADSRYSSSGSRAGMSYRRSGGATLSGHGTPLGQVDPALVMLIRQLAHQDPIGAGASDTLGGGTGWGGEGGNDGRGGPGQLARSGPGGQGHASPPNLIRAHREALRQASAGTLDHLVIDVIGFLFDQILSDPKVPPQMARQIARLQLPVLRVALGDPAFFSSHRHPVRRFINRIASLGAGYEDLDSEQARGFLGKVRALVQEVVAGDFEQIAIYEQKLAELESHVAEQAARDLQASGDAAGLLAEKEDQYRLRQLYAQQLEGELQDLEAPAFLRDFVSRVWSQVLLRAAELHGPDSAPVQGYRRVGRELFLSVHPKANAVQRKAFLAELPRLMHDLTEGMNLIGWPEVQRRAFFGQLMPAHAEALKSLSGRQLDINLMARQLEGALERPAPSREALRANLRLPAQTEGIALPQFSADEAHRVGLMDESAVDWNGRIDVDLDALEPADASLPALPGLPASTDDPEPTHGRELADNVQVGFAYQMHLDGQWQRVRLSHVSPGRSFFIFTRGSRHKKTLSLTQRMLGRLCETGRLRAFEEAALLDRATARARRQLAALGKVQPASPNPNPIPNPAGRAG